MDQPDLDVAVHAQALRGLRRINRLSRVAAASWSALVPLAGVAAGAPLRVLDIACGGGDVLMALARRALNAGVDIEVQGCDINPQAVRLAQHQATASGVPVRFFRLDALRDPLPADFDVLSCSLFLHHLAEEDAVGLLRRMSQAARRMVVVNDLVRSRLGYVLAWAGCRLLSRSPVVHWDGPASVAAAFSVSEARALADRAGMNGALLTRRWPERFLLTWSRQGDDPRHL
jgi:2-polyprenyl-3-methyl-5-hydroxy-6-metoxy-1,4-benzoquinol methylase